VEFDPAEFDFDLADFSSHFATIAEKFEMQWRLARSNHRPKMIILVSKYDHCLVDLLYRHKSGELQCEIPLIISNHPDNQPIANFYGIPYVTIPVPKQGKGEAEEKILSLILQHNPDFMVLARYMQILSNEFVNRYPQRIINIHHSFLPAFVGAKPYHQAFTRGVKLIGATSHYVTEVLDDGPIIEQDVVRISHRDSLDDLLQKGRDLEKVLRFHLDSLEGASVSWNFRVDGPGESRLDGLDGQWMRRVIAIENEARLEGGEPEAFEQIDESPCATRCRD